MNVDDPRPAFSALAFSFPSFPGGSFLKTLSTSSSAGRLRLVPDDSLEENGLSLDVGLSLDAGVSLAGTWSLARGGVIPLADDSLGLKSR